MLTTLVRRVAGLAALGVASTGLALLGATGPAAAATVDHVVAVTGTDHQLWTRSSGSPTWIPRGGYLVDAPVLLGPDHVMGLGRDGNVWVRSTSHDWRPLGRAGTKCAGPSADVFYDGTQEVLVVSCRGSDGAVWTARSVLPSDGGLPAQLGPWSSLQGQAVSGVTVSIDYRGEQFTPVPVHLVVGSDNRVWWRDATSPWQRYSDVACGGSLGVAFSADLAACRDGATGALRHFDFFADPAVDGRSLGGNVLGRPAVAFDDCQSSQRFYALGTVNRVYVAQVRADGTTVPFSLFGGAGLYGLSATSTSCGIG